MTALLQSSFSVRRASDKSGRASKGDPPAASRGPSRYPSHRANQQTSWPPSQVVHNPPRKRFDSGAHGPLQGRAAGLRACTMKRARPQQRGTAPSTLSHYAFTVLSYLSRCRSPKGSVPSKSDQDVHITWGAVRLAMASLWSSGTCWLTDA